MKNIIKGCASTACTVALVAALAWAAVITGVVGYIFWKVVTT